MFWNRYIILAYQKAEVALRNEPNTLSTPKDKVIFRHGQVAYPFPKIDERQWYERNTLTSGRTEVPFLNGHVSLPFSRE
jgi:hypothetical protein